MELEHPKQMQHGQKCVICGRKQTEGIHIGNQLICHSCHEQLVTTDVTDWKYPYFIRKLSTIHWPLKQPVGKHQ
ncbi:MAG: sigma factor G inhibitor Gin [Sporolactobacillus sp.]